MKLNCIHAVRMLCAVLVLAVAVGGCGGTKTEAPPEKSYQEQVIEAGISVMNALVFIKSVQETYEEGTKTEQQVFGSGVVFSDTGLVLTNNHVTEKSSRVTCSLWDKTEVPAKLVGADKDFDIAILQLDMSRIKAPLHVAPFGDSNSLKIGDTVMALGAPLGFERSITQGILSCDNRFLKEIPEALWLQTDAAINPGNSGGPLINVHGEVVGVNTLGIPSYYGQGIGFSIPINIVKAFKDEIISTSKITRSWTGLRLQALREFEHSQILNSSHGVLISGLDPGSPAEQAGVVSGDILLTVNGAPVEGMYQEQLPAIYQGLLRLPRDEVAALTLHRGAETIALNIVPTIKQKQEGDEVEIDEWNMTVKVINQFSEREISFYKNQGVYILGVKDGGNASMSGLYSGDIVVRVENKEINSLEEFREAYNSALDKKIGERYVLFDIIRYGQPKKAVLEYNLKRKPEEEGFGDDYGDE